MSLSAIAIRRPVFAWMLMTALVVFGVISFLRLGVSQLPDVDFPVVSVSLSLNGAAPEIMESQVVDPIEDAISQTEGIRNITSTSQQSSASIAVEFELDRNIDDAMQEVENRITQVLNLLPVNLLPPTVRKSNPEDQPILWLALTANDPSVKLIDLMIFARNYLYDQYGMINGVGNIVMGGYVDPALRVWIDQDKLKQQEMTADDVVQAITNEHIELPAGRVENKTKEFNVRLMGEAMNPVDFGKIAINNRSVLGANYRVTRLNQVATVEEATADVRKISRFNGQLAVGLGMLKQHGSNAVEVANDIRKKTAEIMPTLPKQFGLAVRSDNTRFIKDAVNELNFTLLLSALLTSVVCYLFLGSWTSTLNILLAIPTSIVGAFVALYFMNFTLNTFTLLGLSLAIGIVVDDAIMMLENIVRHRELGEKKVAAALKGSAEITPAAVAATIAVVAIFLPVIFMKGVIGRYFYQYGVTVAVAVLLSLLEALTLTPMRCSRYLTVNHHPTGLAGRVDAFFHWLARQYQRLLGVFISSWKSAALVLFVTTVLFAGSILLARIIPSEMMPAQDQSQMLLRVKLKIGTALEITNGKLKQMEDYIAKRPEVDGYYSAVGGFGGDAVNQGQLFVTLVPKDKRKKGQSELIKEFRKDLKQLIPKTEIVVQDMSLRGFSASRGFPVEFIIQGPNWDKLTELTKQVMQGLRDTGAIVDVNTDVQDGAPEIKIVPDRAKMAARGVPITAVTTALNEMVGGAILNGQTEYAKAGHRYEIEVRLLPDQRTKAEQLQQIFVRNNFGETIPLSQVVDQFESPALQLISRLNRARAITVYGNPAPGHSQQEALKIAQDVAHKILPQGYYIKLTGSSQSFKESMDSLIFALIFGIVVSYMVLASQFNSFLHPIVVLLALPFSISGAFLGLYLCHQSINIYSMIGFILLMGIVKKNSILLVDFTNQVRTEGLEVKPALLKACPIRLRPILMTSMATVAGALPEALSLGPGSETTIPMSVAIIGGVIASTILTLFVVPCAYVLFSKLERPDALLKEHGLA